MIREAKPGDIPRMQLVRRSVKENALSDPALIQDKDYEPFLTHKGKGWICEDEGTLAGFAIADLAQHNIWALFVSPDFEKRGIGRRLHDAMLDWYFSQTTQTVWLSTAPGTRAERFYRKAGWTEAGLYGKGEIRFEMTSAAWHSGTLPS